jgi:hypothetical protein
LERRRFHDDRTSCEGPTAAAQLTMCRRSAPLSAISSRARQRAKTLGDVSHSSCRPSGRYI